MLASSARQGLGKSGTHKKRTQARRSTGDDHTSKHVDSIARASTGSQHGLHGTLTGLPRAGSLKNEEGGGEASKGTVARSSTLRGPEGARSGGVFPERRSSEAGRRSIFQQAARVPAFLWSMLANLSKDSGSKLRGLDAAQVSRRQQGGLPWLTISCSGTFRQCWDLCSLTAVIYCTFAVPYDMTFDPPKGVVASAIDMGVEVFFMTEIVLNFFTSYINEDGVEIKNKQLILANYALSWMPIDLVSSIPAEIIRRVATADGGSASNFEILERLRILRILRLTKLLRLLRIANFMEQIEFSFPSLRTVIGLFRLLFLMGTVAHMQACIFYFIASTNLGNSWVSRLHFGCCDPQLDTFTAYSLKTDDISCMDDVEMPKLGSLYANAIYWSFTTLTTVGYGDIVPCNEMEMLFATSSMVVGSALFAYIVGNIASVVTSIKGQELKLKERMRELQEYIALRKIPKQLADQVRRQCMHLWKNTVFEEDKVLNEFTPQLRKEVVSFVNDHILLSVPTFKVFEGEPILTEIALKLKPSSATAGEVITGYGEIFCDLYILQGGKVEVLDENGVAIETFSTHGSFNELELLSPLFNYTEGATEPVPMRYTTTLRALTFCDLMVLKSTDFQEVLNANGLTDDTVLLETLEKRWTKLLKRMEKRTAFSQQLASENMTVESEHKMRKEWQSARHASLESEGLAPRTATTVAVRRFMRSQSGRDMSPIPVEIEEAPDKMTKRRIERPPSPHRAALHRERRESILSEGSVGEVIGRESPVRGRSQTRRGSTRSAQSGSRDTSPLATDVRHATPLTEALAEARIDDGEHSAGSVAEEGRKLLVGHEEGSHGGRGWNAMRKLKESFTDEASPGRQKPRRPSLEVCVEAFQHGLRARGTPGRKTKGRDEMLAVILQVLGDLQKRMEEQDRLIRTIVDARPAHSFEDSDTRVGAESETRRTMTAPQPSAPRISTETGHLPPR